MYSTQRKSVVESLVYFIIFTLVIGLVGFFVGYLAYQSSQVLKDGDTPNNLSFYRRSADGTVWVNDTEQSWVCFDYDDYKTHVLELFQKQESAGQASSSYERSFP